MHCQALRSRKAWWKSPPHPMTISKPCEFRRTETEFSWNLTQPFSRLLIRSILLEGRSEEESKSPI
jgi:hypothetical protein